MILNRALYTAGIAARFTGHTSLLRYSMMNWSETLPLRIVRALLFVRQSIITAAVNHRTGGRTGLKSLFHGKDLTAGTASKFWSVKDGAITGMTTDTNKTEGIRSDLEDGPVDGLRIAAVVQIVAGTRNPNTAVRLSGTGASRLPGRHRLD